MVTSLLDHQVDTRTEIATLDRRRWVIELELRDIQNPSKNNTVNCLQSAGTR